MKKESVDTLSSLKCVEDVTNRAQVITAPKFWDCFVLLAAESCDSKEEILDIPRNFASWYLNYTRQLGFLSPLSSPKLLNVQ